MYFLASFVSQVQIQPVQHRSHRATGTRALREAEGGEQTNTLYYLTDSGGGVDCVELVLLGVETVISRDHMINVQAEKS